MNQLFTEPYSPWQNKAEREIRDLKKHHCRTMHMSKAPERLWDYGMMYTASLRECIGRETLGGRTPREVITGETPDISKYTEFSFYSWCYFY
jgi:transposase